MYSLEELDLSSTDLRSFPKIYGNLDSLRKLNIRSTSINRLPISIVGNATALQNLELACQWPYNEEFRSLEVLAGSFPGLVSLQITGSGIVRTLDFSHLTYLEKLDLSRSHKLKDVHASLGVHKRIKSICLAYCSKLVEFPRIIDDMSSLEELDLSCTSLKTFPEMKGNVNRLVKLYLDTTEITTLPWSIGRATSLEVISMLRCEYLLTLLNSFLRLQLQNVHISSGLLKSSTDETGQAVELHSSQRKRRKQLIVSEGMRHLSALHIYFGSCESLEELPEPLLAKVVSLFIVGCRSLTSWICSNLVDLLDNYQYLCNLRLRRFDIYPHDFLEAFSEWELVSNMLRKREESFIVYVPGSDIPSWFHYRIKGRSVTAFLPPLAEWDTDKLKGFVLSSINADLKDRSVLLTSEFFNPYIARGISGDSDVLIMYIPINKIRDWEGQNECTLFELNSVRDWQDTELDQICRWGLTLVYSEDEDHPYEVLTEVDDHDDSQEARFRVKIGQSKVVHIDQMSTV